MREIIYKIENPKNFSKTERKIFLDLLKKQGKVKDPTIEKVNRCRLLCVCKVEDKIVSIGAIKPKTGSDFDTNKADLDNLKDSFNLELGYCFTLNCYAGKGFSSAIVKLLLDKVKNENIMASTELRTGNPMIKILEKNGFKQFGKPWESIIHGGALGLFLKF